MWRWMKRWRDWAINDVITPHRLSSSSRGLHVSAEKAGLQLSQLPIPWNADAVLVEAALRPPPPARRRGDYSVRVPGQDPIIAETFLKEDASDRFRLLFRLPTPKADTRAEVFWRHHLLGTIDLPILSPEAFFGSLQVTHANALVMIDGRLAPARTFISSQCRGVYASALIRSNYGLAALADLPLEVHFRREDGSESDLAAAALSPLQLNGKEAPITVASALSYRKCGDFTVEWRLAGRTVLMHKLRGITARSFHKSLRVVDTRFVVEMPNHPPAVVRHLPPLEELVRAAPYFVLGHGEQAAAASLDLEIVSVPPGASSSGAAGANLKRHSLSVLLSDGPRAITMPLVEVAELRKLASFELKMGTMSLGHLPISPVPMATFNAEAGFKPPPDFIWSATAEEELAERLTKLMNPDPPKEG